MYAVRARCTLYASSVRVCATQTIKMKNEKRLKCFIVAVVVVPFNVDVGHITMMAATSATMNFYYNLRVFTVHATIHRYGIWIQMHIVGTRYYVVCSACEYTECRDAKHFVCTAYCDSIEKNRTINEEKENMNDSAE